MTESQRDTMNTKISLTFLPLLSCLHKKTCATNGKGMLCQLQAG